MSTDAASGLPAGKELAANDKKTRDLAVRKLRNYMSSIPDLSRTDLLKLWKGIFYGFWMSDKPLVQQALAMELASLISDCPTEATLTFLETFWEIFCAEWHGIDRIRLDKYYMLLRRVIFFSFLYLANQQWNPEVVDDYAEMLLAGPMHPTDRSKPDAIRYHIMQIYFEELEKVLDLQREQNEDFDLPVESVQRPITVTAKSNVNKVVRTKAKEALKNYEKFLKEKEEQEKDDEDDSMEE